MARLFDGSTDQFTIPFTLPGGVWSMGVRFLITSSNDYEVLLACADTSGFNLMMAYLDVGGVFGMVADGAIDEQVSPLTAISRSTTVWGAVICTIRDTDDLQMWCHDGTSAKESEVITADAGALTVDQIQIGALNVGGGGAEGFCAGDFAEFFVMTGEPNDAQIDAYFSGYSPDLLWPAAMDDYKRLMRNLNGETGDRGSLTITDQGTTVVSAQPRTIYPSRRSIFVPAAAVGGGLSIPVAYHHYQRNLA